MVNSHVKRGRFRRLHVALAVLLAGAAFSASQCRSRPARTTGIAPAPAGAQARALFRVVVDGKHGFIDRTGAIVIPTRFAKVYPFSEGLAAATEGDERWGYIDERGEWVIEPRFKMPGKFSEGLATARVEYTDPEGYIDRRGNWVLPPQFEAAEPFQGGRALVGRRTMLGRFKSSIDAGDASDWRWRAIDRTGKDLGAVKRSYEGEFGPDGLRAVWRNHLVGFGDRSGAMVIAPQYEQTTGFSEGLCGVQPPGQKWGYIDRTGAWVIPPQFDWGKRAENGLVEVVINRKTGYLDRTGKWVWEPSG